MREKIKQSIASGDNSINLLAGRDLKISLEENFPTDLVDQKTEEEVEKLKKSRFFLEFDGTRSSLRLGRRLAEGDLSGSSDEVRGRALAWCARLLSRSEELERAEEFLKLAKTLGDSTENKIAEAFILSQKGVKAAALKTLADIDLDISHSASLMIVAHHDGVEKTQSWMDAAGYRIGDLDSDGKSILLSSQLQLGCWKEVGQTACALSEADFDETPILHHLMALATLVPTVPQDFRSIVLTQVPFEAREFPLSSDAVAMDARRAAHQHFLNAVEVAEQFTCSRAARMDDEYVLWLELCDPDPAQRAHGKKRLENKLRDPDTALGFVRYAFQFGIKLDRGLVERNIEQSIARNGGVTIDTAIARFTLAFMQPNPEEAANYIARYYDQLTAHIDPNLIWSRQIEMLVRAGLIERASEVIERLREKGLPAEQESNFRRCISEAQGNDPIESCKTQYETTGALGDLINLVAELEEHHRWDDLCEFGRRLFEETHTLRDAEHLSNALYNTHRSEALVGFIKENTDLLSQSSHLRMVYAWGLYCEGAFLECRTALAELSDEVGGANYRALRVNLGIATGDIASLSAYIADEYKNRDERSAYDLISAAQLAFRLGLPLVRDLVFKAVAKADEDSTVLTSAYFIATSAGWEDDPQVFLWLEKAAELSRADGPLKRMSLKDVLDQKPEWDRHESETWRLLAQGQMPVFLAAQSLNRTLIDLTLFPALTNLIEIDPRRRSAIPAYSGKRVPLAIDISGKAVALDATALLTLRFLKILDVVLDAFETVYIPHSTLGWLFEERQKATFHQPSRIANAHNVRDFLATDFLEKFMPTTTASSDLSAQIGGDLAAFIAEAEQVRDGDETQRLVVCSFPVHRLSSLMEEEADLSAHATVLSSCLAVVEKLRQKGQITADEEKRARAYLQLHENPWISQPDIANGAILYLDDLSVIYFLHLGFLGKFKVAGLRAVVSPRGISQTDALISYELISNDVKEILEDIQASLSSRLESGQVRVGRRCYFDEFKEKSSPKHPSLGIIALAPHCNVAIIDDRFLNQHLEIDSGDAQAPVYSTLDLLDALVAADLLSDDNLLEHRTRLRRAGYFFVPVSVEELERCLRESTIANGEVVETAELKAIRESVLRVRMSDWLQLPKEAPWLDGTLKVFVHVLKKLWKDEAHIEEITARSNWLVDQIDLRGWAHSFVPENADNIVRIGRAKHILLLLMPLTDVQQRVVDAYWKWVEERVLAPMQEQFPKVYEWLVGWHRNFVVKMAESEFSEGRQFVTNVSDDRASKASAALKFVPPLIRKSLLDEQCFREEYGLKLEFIITFGSIFSIKQSELYGAVRTVLAGKTLAELNDTEDRIWKLMIDTCEDEIPNLVLSSDQQRLVLPGFSVLFEDVSTRIRFLEELVSDVNLPLSAQEKWRNILEERALEDDEVDAFERDIRDTPVHMERTIRSEITAGKSSVSSLVPNSRRYFERLIGIYNGSGSVRDYAATTGYEFFKQLTEWRPYEGFLFCLLLSSHLSLTAEIKIDHLDKGDLERAFEYLEKYGDTLSQLGAFEVGLRILPDRPEVEPFLLRLVHRIRNDDAGSKNSEFNLFSALFVLVDGELARTHLLVEEPPFYRRLASLAQAALIHRQIVQCEIDYDDFSNWVFSTNRSQHFYMQSFADMRNEPRWNPDWVSASQMQADFFGRIMISGTNFQENLGEGELRDTILGDGEQSLIKLCNFLRSCFPGPLEGTEDCPNTLPDEFAHIIEGQLKSEEVGVDSFIALVNSSILFRIPSGYAELATKALRLCNYTLAKLESKSQLIGILNGLATVAAITRNLALADELRILVRRYRCDSEYGFSIVEAMQLCLVASASRKDLIEWRQFAGEWLTELSFGELKGKEGDVFHSHLLVLLHLVPELWISCARADAALDAWCFR